MCWDAVSLEMKSNVSQISTKAFFLSSTLSPELWKHKFWAPKSSSVHICSWFRLYERWVHRIRSPWHLLETDMAISEKEQFSRAAQVVLAVVKVLSGRGTSLAYVLSSGDLDWLRADDAIGLIFSFELWLRSPVRFWDIWVSVCSVSEPAVRAEVDTCPGLWTD